jgi:hypothetical protein
MYSLLQRWRQMNTYFCLLLGPSSDVQIFVDSQLISVSFVLFVLLLLPRATRYARELNKRRMVALGSREGESLNTFLVFDFLI